MTDSPLRRLLDRGSEAVLLGLLVLLAALPVITGFLALTAAALVLSDPDDERPVGRRFLAALQSCRDRPRLPAVRVQLLVLAASLVAVADLGFALGTSAPYAVRVPIGALGVLLALAVCFVPPVAAALAAQSLRHGLQPGVVPLLRSAVLLVTGRPRRLLFVPPLLLVAVAAGATFPALSPFVLAVSTVIVLRLAVHDTAGVAVRFTATSPTH